MPSSAIKVSDLIIVEKVCANNYRNFNAALSPNLESQFEFVTFDRIKGFQQIWCSSGLQKRMVKINDSFISFY